MKVINVHKIRDVGGDMLKKYRSNAEHLQSCDVLFLFNY